MRLRRPLRAPLAARCGQQADAMMGRGGRALEPSSPTSWLAHTTRRRSVQACEATAVRPTMVATDERSVRWQGTVRARQHLTLKPEGARIEINPLLSLYNHSLAGR